MQSLHSVKLCLEWLQMLQVRTITFAQEKCQQEQCQQVLSVRDVVRDSCRHVRTCMKPAASTPAAKQHIPTFALRIIIEYSFWLRSGLNQRSIDLVYMLTFVRIVY